MWSDGHKRGGCNLSRPCINIISRAVRHVCLCICLWENLCVCMHPCACVVAYVCVLCCAAYAHAFALFCFICVCIFFLCCTSACINRAMLYMYMYLLFFVTYSHLFCFVELVHACSRKYKFKFKCTCVYLCSWQTRSLTPELVSLQVRASSRRRVPVAGIVKKVMIVRATGTEVMQFFQESCSWSTLSYWWPGDRAERRGAKHLAFEARRASWVRAGGWCLLVPMREQIGWLKEICGVWWGRREGSEIQGCPVYMWESLVLSP